MSKKLVYSVSAIIIAVAALVFCIGISRAHSVSVIYDYAFSLVSTRGDTKGSATANYGDDGLNIGKAPTEEGAELFLYFLSQGNDTELIADSDGKFFANVGGYTDTNGCFKPEKTVPSEFFTVWYVLTETDTYTQLTFYDCFESYVGAEIKFTYQWYDADGPIPGQTSSGVQRTDCYCIVTVKTANVTYVTSLPEVTVSSYSINYEPNGGTFEPGYTPQNSYFEEQVILPDSEHIAKVGHRFDGWYDNPELSGQAVTAIGDTETGDKTFYAKWTPEVYLVTLYLNGGEAAFDITQYTYGEGAELPNAEREGYNFLGWYTNANFDGDAMLEICVDETGDLDFYARWEASEYEIEYETDGGNFTGDVPCSYTFGVGAELPAVTKDHYRFDGWYDNPELSGQAVTVIGDTETGDKTFYAKWTPEVYLVTLYFNGGEAAFDVTQYTYGEGAELPNAEREGYNFLGWYTNANFDGDAMLEICVDETGDLDFYARWEASEYEIEYETDGGNFTGDVPCRYTFGVGAQLPAVTKDHYRFDGWYDNPELSGQAVTVIGDTETGDKTFYAKWTPEVYLVTLYLNGGEAAFDITQYTFGEGAWLPTAYLEGHSFDGWFADEDFNGSPLNNITESDSGDLTFYAKWSPMIYTIQFVLAGGVINSGEISSYTYGVGADLPQNVTRGGYSFLGWYDNPEFSGDMVIILSETDFGDIVLYAHWFLEGYSIDYELNGGDISGVYTTAYIPGDEVTLPENVTKHGYVFKGWYSNENFDGDSFTTFSSGDDGNLKFYAKWEAAVYTIDYVGYEPSSYTFGDTVELFIPTRTGHIFGGWFATQNFEGDAVTQITPTDYGDKTYYAKWTAKTYSITYVLSGGEANGEVITVCTFGETVTLNDDITKTGYLFKGWYANLDGGRITTFTVGDNGNLKFYAKWEAAVYTIDYVGYEPSSYTFGDTVELFIPTRTGHIFGGWFVNQNFEGDEITQITSTDYGDKIFYAKWTAKTYSITYEYDGGIANGEVITTGTFGETVTLNDDITKTGFVFKGWYADIDGDRITTFTVGDNGNLKFYAKWEAAVYAIDYVGYEPSSYTYGDTVELFIPTRTGYIFGGWFATQNFEGDEITQIIPTDYGDKEYYAKWTAKTYSITYVLYGGEANGEVITVCTFGETVTLNDDITKTGYLFKGWYANLDGDRITTFTVGDNGNLTFYAKWEAAVYTIDYVGYEPSSYTYGDTVELFIPTRTGYIFGGWFANQNFEGDEITQITPTDYGDKTYYAKWTAKTYSITYVLSGGEANGEVITACTFGETVTLNDNITKTGFVFKGWYANLDGGRITTFTVGDNGNLKFYAKWEAAVYTIDYVGYEPSSYTFGDTVELFIPTRTGYIFGGWFANQNFEGDEITQITSTDYGDKTYYAKWTAKTYSITYEYDGGIANGEVITACTFGETVTLNDYVTKTGFVFKGWYANLDGDRITTFTVGDNGNLKFYAKWEAAVYTITYVINGGVLNDGTTGYTYGSAVSLSEVVRAGFIFCGWFADEEFSGDAVTQIIPTDYGDKTYYAKWAIDAEGNDLVGGSGVYDENGGIELYFEVTTSAEVVYRWYFNGKAVSGGGNGRLTVKNVDESGGYYCVATITADGAETLIIQSNTASVMITPKQLESPVVTFNANSGVFAVDGIGTILVSSGGDYMVWQASYRPSESGVYSFIARGGGNYADSAPTEITLVNMTFNSGDGYTVAAEAGGEYFGGGLVMQGEQISVVVTVSGSHSKSAESLVLICGGERLTGAITGLTAVFEFEAYTDISVSADGLEINKYQITVSQGVGYILESSAGQSEHGGSVTITFRLLDGFNGGSIYVNGELWTQNGGKYSDISSDINVTVTGVTLNSNGFHLIAENGTYNGGGHFINVISDVGFEVEFKWYIGKDTVGSPVKTATGLESSFAVTDAGAYTITVVISAIGAEDMKVVKSIDVVISKAALGEPSASYSDGVITLSTPGGGAIGYKLYGSETLLESNTLEVTGAGTYTFVAVGDKNHYDSEPFSITVHAVTLVFEDKTVAVLYAAHGSTLSITVTADKESAADVFYKFSGWYDGEILFSGLVERDILLTARFTEYIKTVTGGGVTITSDDGMETDAAIELSDEVGEAVIESFVSSAATGVAVYFVDISLSGASGGSYTVTYRLPDYLWGVSLAVYHYLPDGTVERVQSYVMGGNIVFVTSGFSPFAFFDVTQYTLRGVDSDGNAYFLGSYINGDNVTLSAVAHPAAEGFIYIFDGWFADEEMQTPLSGVTVDGNITLYAKFTKKEVTSAVYYNVTAVDKNGNMYFIGTYAAGTSADLTGYKVTPNGSYVYDGLYNQADERVEQVVVNGNICLYVKFIYIDNGNSPPDPEPVYRTLSGVSGGTVYNLFSYEDGTVLSLALFSLPAYEAGGKTYIFEGWYSDAELTDKISSVTMDGDTTVYAKFIAHQDVEDGLWIAISVSAASATLLLIVLIIVISIKVKPRRVQALPVPVQAQAAVGQALMRAEENYRYVCGELDNAENYLKANPDREKSRSVSNARGLLKECEYILKGMRDRANTALGAKENNFAEASLDRLFYEINSIISSEIF